MVRLHLVAGFLMAVSLASLAATSPICVGQDDSSAFPVVKKEVGFRDGSTVLQGTVFLPDIKAGFPGVVILGGSERGPRNPYKERTARFFAQGGVAALRLDWLKARFALPSARNQKKEHRTFPIAFLPR